MKTKNTFKKIIVTVLNVLLILVATLVITTLITTQGFECITSVEYKDGYLFGLDSASTRFTIFRTDPKTGASKWKNIGNQSLLSNVMMSDTTVISSVTAADKNRLYFVKESNHYYDDSVESTKEIALWDISTDKIESVIAVDDIDDHSLMGIKYTNTGLNLFYSTIDYTSIKQVALDEAYNIIDIKTYSVPGSITKTLFDENGVMYITTNTGDVYLCEDDGEHTCIFLNDGSYIDQQNYNYTISDGYLYFRNYKSDKTYCIDINSDDLIPVETKPPYKSAESFNDRMLTQSSIIGSSVKTGVLNGDSVLQNKSITVPYIKSGVLQNDNCSISLAICGDVEALIDTLHVGSTAMFWILFGSLVASIIIVIFGSVLSRKLLSRIKSTYSGRLKLVTLLLMIFSMLMVYVIIRFDLYLHASNEVVYTQAAVSNNCVHLIDKEEFSYIYNNGYPSSSSTTIWNNIYTNNSVFNYTLFYEKDGQFYSADGNYTYNIPVLCASPDINLNEYNTIKGTLNTTTFSSCSYQNRNGRTISTAINISDDMGFPAVFVTSVDVSNFNEYYGKDSKNLFLVLELFIVFAFGIIFYRLNSVANQLSSIKEFIKKLIDGDLGVQAEVKGKNEISVMTNSFNHMSSILKTQSAQMDLHMQLYNAVIPTGIFNQIYGEYMFDYNKVGFKEIIDTQILCLRVSSKTKDESEVLSVLNTFSDNVGSLGGSIEYTDRTSFTYYHGKKDGEILQKIIPYIKELNEDGDFIVSAIIKYAPVELSILGTDDCKILHFREIERNRAVDLLEVCDIIQPGVIINERAVNTINTSNYHLRHVGALRIKDSSQTEHIFEILDSCSQKIGNQKLTTKDSFEEGVDAFLKDDYEKARSIMVRVLYQNKEDRVARFYVKESERRANIG